MGKGALILALASIMATTSIYITQDQSSADKLDEEVDYQEQVIAREAAQSAFNVVAGKVQRDFDGYRATMYDLAYRDAEYDYSAIENEDGSVAIAGTGRYGDHEYVIRGVVDDGDARLLDALTIDGPREQFDINQISLISGIDTNPNGTVGDGQSVHAVLALEPEVRDDILSLGLDSRLLGVDGQADVVSGEPQISLPGLESTIKNFSGELLTTYGSNQAFSSGSFGSLDTPRVMRVNGDLTLSGSFTGYGVLFLTGEFRMEDDATWTGLVLVNNTTGQQHVLRDDAVVHGVVVLRSSIDVAEAGMDAEDPNWGTTICHVPPGNPDLYHTITVGEPAVTAHLSQHADYEGPCTPDEGVETNWPENPDKGKGSTKHDVCHRPPGNPANQQTITIARPAWPAHRDHGDVMGACSDEVETTNYDPISLNLYHNSSIEYSSMALGALEDILPQVDLTSDVITVTKLSEEPRRISTMQQYADL